MSRISRLIDAYLYFKDSDEEECRLSILASLECLIDTNPNSIRHHCLALMKSLLRLLYELSNGPCHPLLLEKTISCIRRVTQEAPDECQHIAKGIDQVKVNPSFDKIISELF